MSDIKKNIQFHLHEDELGGFQKCYHECKNVLKNPWFYTLAAILNTLSFPLEHFLWYEVPPFNIIAQYIGLIH